MVEVMFYECYHCVLSSYVNQLFVMDGEYVYVFFGLFGFYVYDFDGNFQWFCDFNVKMKVFNQFGEFSLLELYGNKLVMLFDYDGQLFIEVVDKCIGEMFWKKLRDEEIGWILLYIVEYDGQLQVIMIGGNYVCSNDFVIGKEFWCCVGMICYFILMLVVKHGLVYVVSVVQECCICVIWFGWIGDLIGIDVIVW